MLSFFIQPDIYIFFYNSFSSICILYIQYEYQQFMNYENYFAFSSLYSVVWQKAWTRIVKTIEIWLFKRYS